MFAASLGKTILKGATVPAPLPAFGRVDIRKFLVHGLKPTPRTSLTETMQQNLKDYENLIKQMRSTGEVATGDICICELDRAFGKTYKHCLRVNTCPCLKTCLKYLFVISVDDVDYDDDKREFFRWMMPFERPGLQGVSPGVSVHFRAGSLIHACGNAYPVPLIAACAVPVLKLIESWGGLNSWPPKNALNASKASLDKLPNVAAFFESRIPKKVLKKGPKKPASKMKGLKKSKGSNNSRGSKNSKGSQQKKPVIKKKPATSSRNFKKPAKNVGKRPASVITERKTAVSHGFVLAKPKPQKMVGCDSDDSL